MLSQRLPLAPLRPHPDGFCARFFVPAKCLNRRHVAINSQPPGSVAGSLRITEQGEMVMAKFGLPGVARHNIEMLTTAVLLATTSPAQARKPEWTKVMDVMARSDHRRALPCTPTNPVAHAPPRSR